MTPEPKSPYAETKLAGERLLEQYRRPRWAAGTTSRASSTSSARARIRARLMPPRSRSSSKKPCGDEPIGIHGDGGQTRDFVHVTDIVGALAYAGASADMHGTYNVGYGRQPIHPRRSPGSHSPHRLPIPDRAPAEPRAGDVRHSLASNERLLAAGWRPRSSVAAGLVETVDYFRSLKA
jgi:UDP-glucose 4-epimerase